MRRFLGDWIVLIIALVPVLGCQHVAVLKTPHRHFSSPQELFDAVWQTEAKISSLKGDAKLRLNTADFKGAVDTFVAVEASGRLHMEMVDFFGRPQMMIVSNGVQLKLYDLHNERFYVGRATADNVRSLLPVQIDPNVLAGLLLGRGLRSELVPSGVRFEATSGLWLLVGEMPFHWEAQIDEDALRIVRWSQKGPAPFTAIWEDLADEATFRLPRKLKIEFDAHSKAEWSYGDVTLNGPKEDALFELTAPPGVVPVVLDSATSG